MSLSVRVLVVMCGCAIINGQLSNFQSFGQNNWGMGNNFNNNNNNLRTSWGNQRNIGWWNGPWGANGNRNREYRTCIGYNNQRDEIRVTVETKEPDVMNRFGFNFNQRDSLRFKAVVISRSELQGQFNFVVTQFGRVEDSNCQSRALGDVLPSNEWWNRNRLKGVIGSPVVIVQRQATSYTTDINSFTMDEFNGHAVGLCQTTSLSGNTCSMINLCCKMGRDTRDVTLGYTQGPMQGGVMGTGNIGGGIMGTGTGGTGGGFTQPGGGFTQPGGGFTQPGGGFSQTGPSLPTGQNSNTETTVDVGNNGLGSLTF